MHVGIIKNPKVIETFNFKITIMILQGTFNLMEFKMQYLMPLVRGTHLSATLNLLGSRCCTRSSGIELHSDYSLVTYWPLSISVVAGPNGCVLKV